MDLTVKKHCTWATGTYDINLLVFGNVPSMRKENLSALFSTMCLVWKHICKGQCRSLWDTPTICGAISSIKNSSQAVSHLATLFFVVVANPVFLIYPPPPTCFPLDKVVFCICANNFYLYNMIWIFTFWGKQMFFWRKKSRTPKEWKGTDFFTKNFGVRFYGKFSFACKIK